MNKIVLACVLAISCSTVSIAKSAKEAQALVAQAGSASAVDANSSMPASGTPAVVPAPIDSETAPHLHGTLPLAPTNPLTAPASSTTTTTTTSTSTTNDLPADLKTFDATVPNLQTTYPAGTLQGTANITDITMSARNMTRCPLQRDRDKGLKYVEVTVKNSGQNIAVILCNSAHADVGTTKLVTAPASASVDSDMPRLNGKGRLAVGVVAAFSFGYAAPILYENLTPDQHSKRSLGDAIGRDGARREVEAGHFGVRVIMPGDETTGWIAFRCPRDQDVKSLVVPISYTRSAIPAGSITIPVANSVTN